MIRQAQQTGYILLPVIVVITLVAAIALLMNTESALESNTAASELDTQQVRYVAEAGMNHAQWLMQQQGCGVYTDISNQAIASDSYSTVLTTDLGTTSSYTIAVDQDTWIRNDFPDNNHGGDVRQHTKYEAGKIENILIRYDLSAIPAKAAILSARAWFYVDIKHPEGPIEIHTPTADWLETDATWTSMGDKLDAAIVAMLPAQANDLSWVSTNLTAQVQGWVNGQPNYGIVLTSSSEKSHGQYASRESANAPYLEVTVGIAPSSPALLKSVGTLSNGIERKILRNDVTLYQAPLLIERRPDASEIDDAYIWKSNQTTNYGAGDESWASTGSSNESLSLYRFNLSDLKLPPQAKITGATLSLYHRSGNDANVPITAQRITSDWKEDEVTWIKRDNGNNWDNPGGDYDADVISTTLVGSTGPGSTKPLRYEWDIGRLLLGWLDGSYPNYGVVLRTEEPGTLGERFDTSDHLDPIRHPRLIIHYMLPCGQASMAPQGSGTILMVVVNPTTLVPSDDAKKSLFEAWGYTVSVVGESANQATYDAAVAVNDVVFISETVNSNAVGTKLADAPIGVVSQDGDYNADLGIAAGNNWTVDTAIDVTSTDHYITWPFSVGPLKIYATGMEQLTVSGSEAAGLQTLAESSGGGSLVVLDTGAALDGGGTAAGRRVMLPLGREGNFVWDQLNNNGRLIVQRALTWGAGLDAVKVNPQLLLVVVNPASLTAQESAKKALIEGWGYAVNPIDESDTQPNFDAALAANDVVFITEDVTASNINTKLVNATIGIVTEEVNIAELGISSSVGWDSGTVIDIKNPPHYITQPFGASFLTVLTASESLAYTNGLQAPDLLRLGTSTSGNTLVALETGGALHAGVGGNAAGRRVQLPWGGNTFDISHLNDDGRTILRRALEWGEGAVLQSTVLMVVADPASLATQESSKKTLIESWGYIVNLIDDADNQAKFNNDAAVNDVVYVSASINGGSLADKLTGSTTPIVNEFAGKLDNFGFSSGTGVTVLTDTFTATNAGHYIGEPFAGSAVTHFTSSLTMPVVSGTVAPGLTSVASIGGLSSALPTLDTGAQRWDGSPSPARRVHLPFGAATASQLTADGETLLQRALEWAIGTEASLGPIAHWKLDETGGFNAEDSAGDNDGMLTGGNDWIPALIDGGLDFDGSNDYVDVGSFDVSGSGITMMGWFNAEAIATDDGRIVSKANGPNEGDAWWQLSSTDSGSDRYLRMRIKAGGTTTTMADSSVNLSTGQWYLAVATYSNATGDMKLYLNRTEIASGTHAVGGAVDTDAAVPVAIGANGTAERFFNGVLDDVRVYDYALTATEIADLYDANAPPPPFGYTEMFQTWSATGDDAWQTVDLGTFGVPANAVAEVAVINSDIGKEYFGGVRAVGSSLQRRFQLHEAEGGGVDAVTMHVQADASSQIQHYSDKSSRVRFILLGYWTGATYVERFDAFKAGANASWQSHDLGAYGVGANQIAEIAMSQTSTSIEWLVGTRSAGSILQRRIKLHEAESGGIDMVTLQVASDASSMIEVYAEANSVVDFHLLGYWSTPPGTYTETGGVHGQATVSASWQTIDLSSFGIPADSIAQFVMSNERDGNENQMGLRETGSTIPGRRLDLQEAESGGGDLGTMHVQVDASSQIQWAAEYGATEGYFYPVGWWVLTP